MIHALAWIKWVAAGVNRDLQLLDSSKAQVMGHNAAKGFAASQGQFELNVYKPLIALDTLDSVRLLAGARCSQR